MGLKCSVLGHKYGEATVEREREEQGSEVVITIQERETCARCGNTRIVSENKEVTSIETPDAAVDEQASTIASNGDEHESEAVADGRTAERDGDPRSSPGPARDAVTPVFEDSDEAVGEDIDPVDPETDDAEIMEPNEEGVVSGDAELDEPSTAVDVPDAEPNVAHGEESNPETDDGLIIDDDREDGDTGRAPGEWPEEPASEQDDWKPETVLGDDGDDGGDEPDVEPLQGSAVTVPEGTFVCEECGFTTDVDASSLRAGDFCPECHKGALVQQRGG